MGIGRLLSQHSRSGEHVSTSLLETLDLNKTYGPTVAAQDVTITLQPGRVHALIGENGAGKSTVIKMITGLVHPTSGHIRWQGRLLDIQQTP